MQRMVGLTGFCFISVLAGCGGGSATPGADSGVGDAELTDAGRCPLAPNATNGTVVSDGETAVYTCNLGFRLVGDATSTCSAEGVWGGTRSCEPNLRTDETTGLMWEAFPPRTAVTRDFAVEYCEGLELSGHDDFRLPAVRDLVTTAGAEWRYSYYDEPLSEWTDTGVASSLTVFFLVRSNVWADATWDLVATTAQVRCVRGTPVPTPVLSLPGDGTVVDSTTGLIWQRQSDGVDRNYVDSMTYCSEIALPGTGWRLPTGREYQTLVDYTVTATINATMFPAFMVAQSNPHRTADRFTTVELGAGRGYGNVFNLTSGSEEYDCLCVRDL